MAAGKHCGVQQIRCKECPQRSDPNSNRNTLAAVHRRSAPLMISVFLTQTIYIPGEI